MSDTNANDADSPESNDFDSAESPQRYVTINRDGSGHTINVNGTIGAVILGIMSLVLLWALLRSEARNRELQTQLLNSRP